MLANTHYRYRDDCLGMCDLMCALMLLPDHVFIADVVGLQYMIPHRGGRTRSHAAIIADVAFISPRRFH